VKKHAVRIEAVCVDVEEESKAIMKKKMLTVMRSCRRRLKRAVLCRKKMKKMKKHMEL